MFQLQSARELVADTMPIIAPWKRQFVDGLLRRLQFGGDIIEVCP